MYMAPIHIHNRYVPTLTTQYFTYTVVQLCNTVLLLEHLLLNYYYSWALIITIIMIIYNWLIDWFVCCCCCCSLLFLRLPSMMCQHLPLTQFIILLLYTCCAYRKFHTTDKMTEWNQTKCLSWNGTRQNSSLRGCSILYWKQVYYHTSKQ